MSVGTSRTVCDTSGQDFQLRFARFHAALQQVFQDLMDGRGHSRMSQLLLGRPPRVRLRRIVHLADSLDSLGEGASRTLAGEIRSAPEVMELKRALAWVSRGYGILARLGDPLESKELDVPLGPDFDPEVYEQVPGHFHVDDIRGWRDDLVENMSPYLDWALVHGSAATRDYTPFSDIDDSLVVSSDTVGDPDALAVLCQAGVKNACWFYRIDPLHHHRHFWISAHDLRNYSVYNMPNLPPSVLERSLVVLGKGPIRLNIRAEDSAMGHAAWKKMAKSLGDLADISIGTRWWLKYLLSNVTLAPCMALGAAGRNMYKKEAIAAFMEHASGAGCECLQIAGELRQDWTTRRTPAVRTARRWILERAGNPFLYEWHTRLVAPRLSGPERAASRQVQQSLPAYIDALAAWIDILQDTGGPTRGR